MKSFNNNPQGLKLLLSTFFAEVWNQGNFSDMEKFIAAKYEIKNDPGDPWDGLVLDIPTFKERVLYSRIAFPDLHFAIQELIAENDKVAVSWVMSGTHKGDLPQLPATGRPFSITGLTIYYFAKNKICGHTQAFHRLGFISQIKFMG